MTERVLIVGADRVMPKLFYFAQALNDVGVGYSVYSHDGGEQARVFAVQAGVELLAGPPHQRSVRRMLRDCWAFWGVLRRQPFLHAELYSDYHILASWAYFLILRWQKVPVVLWCRGELFDWDDFTWWQRAYFRYVIPRCRLVILKETYMLATLKRGGVRLSTQVLELHNTVPLPHAAPRSRHPHRLRLLFLNMFKTWRNVEFCVEVAAQLKRQGLEFEMKLVGEKSDSAGLADEAAKVRAAITRHGLASQVTVHPFTTDPIRYFDDADIFVLPANLIYCNYALLEAMSHGIVPIVNSADADFAKIIDHGVSGFGHPLDAPLWAQTIADLASRPERWQQISREARLRVESSFSVDSAFKRYVLATGLNTASARQ